MAELLTNTDADDTTSTAKKACILVADDSKLMRKAALKMLGADYDILLAEDGAEAWEQLQGNSQIQLVFTDLNMPRVDGFELLERVRTATAEGLRNIPMIVVTGADDDGASQERAYELGATDFISKPFNSTEIKARAEAHASYHQHSQFLEQQAKLDSLTGQLNKRGFDEQLKKDIGFANRHSSELALVYVEVARFNELFVAIGRAGADKVLKHIGKQLVAAVRAEDAVGRIGLARFAFSLPSASPDGAAELAARLGKIADRLNFVVAGKPLVISLSVGCCTVPEHYETTEDELLAHAKSCLEKALSEEVSSCHVHHLLDDDTGITGDALNDTLSIDELLAAIDDGRSDLIVQKLPVAAKRLAPLMALLQQHNLLAIGQ